MKLIDYERIKDEFLEKSTLQKQEYGPIEQKYKEITNVSFDNIDKMLKYFSPIVIAYCVSYSLCRTLVTYLMKVIALSLWSLPAIYMPTIIITEIIAKKIIKTNTRTFKEKYAEEIKLLIELEKMRKRESIFYSAYMNLKSEIDTKPKMSKKWDLREKEEAITIERLQSIIEQAKGSIEEDYKNIDFLITKNILCNDNKLYSAKTLNIPTVAYFLMILGVVFIMASPMEYISNQIIYGLYTILSVIGTFVLATLFVPNKMKKLDTIIIELRKQYLQNDEYKSKKNTYDNIINLDDEIKKLVKKIVEQEIELAKYQVKLKNLTTQTTNLRKTRILPRKEIISYNLPKRKILGIKKLENKRYN